MIEPAHFWIGVCKAMDLNLSALLDAAAPEWKEAEEKIAADLSDVKEALTAVGLSSVELRRGLRAELGREPEAAERPLHRSPALRKIFKQAVASDILTLEKMGCLIGLPQKRVSIALFVG